MLPHKLALFDCTCAVGKLVPGQNPYFVHPENMELEKQQKNSDLY
jgi:hypothetical protein